MENIFAKNSVFFEDFLKISDIKTILFLFLLVFTFVIFWILQKRKVNFSKRIILATGVGFVLGMLIQIFSGFSENPMSIKYVQETTTWYSLFGNGFIDLIRMLVIPIVMISIINVIINMKEGTDIAKLARITLLVTMTMVTISVIIGLLVGFAFDLGSGNSIVNQESQIKSVSSIVDTVINLIPSNPVKAMVDVNIIALVIISAFFGIAAKRMSKKYNDIVKPFFDLVNALNKIIISVAMTIIKFMPFAVVALLTNTIAQRGIKAILEVGKFIMALYVAVAVMFIIQLIALMIFKVNPIIYIKKSISVMILAFTSRSSVGSLPLTIETLTNKLGVNDATASFVAGFGTTAGMQGCSGVFPAMLIIFVSNMAGINIDITLIIMSIIVISIGSLGIAGIPGTASMAASVALSGVGLSSNFPIISPILAIDPLIDMGRTLLNVTGSLTNAIIVDIKMKQFDMDKYKDMSLINEKYNTLN